MLTQPLILKTKLLKKVEIVIQQAHLNRQVGSQNYI